VDLRGDDTEYVGFGTRGVQTILKAASTTTFYNITAGKYEGIFINHTSQYAEAWYDSFNQTLSTNGLVYNTHYRLTSTEIPTGDPIIRMWRVSLWIDPNVVSRFTLTTAYVEVVTSEVGIAT
jgi:hypothetical protein